MSNIRRPEDQGLTDPNAIAAVRRNQQHTPPLTTYQLGVLERNLESNGCARFGSLVEVGYFCRAKKIGGNSYLVIESRGSFFLEKAEGSAVRTWETTHKIGFAIAEYQKTLRPAA